MDPIEISSDSSVETTEQESGDSTEQESYQNDRTYYFSDRSYDMDSEDGTPLSLRHGCHNLVWETFITNGILYKSGVMHFPRRVGKLIPETIGSILVNLKGTNLYYEMSLGVAVRSSHEKYIHGLNWRIFIEDRNLKVGDVLEWEIQSQPIEIIVEVVRKPIIKKGGNSGGAEGSNYGGKKKVKTCLKKNINMCGKKNKNVAGRRSAAV